MAYSRQEVRGLRTYAHPKGCQTVKAERDCADLRNLKWESGTDLRTRTGKRIGQPETIPTNAAHSLRRSRRAGHCHCLARYDPFFRSCSTAEPLTDLCAGCRHMATSRRTRLPCFVQRCGTTVGWPRNRAIASHLLSTEELSGAPLSFHVRLVLPIRGLNLS